MLSWPGGTGTAIVAIAAVAEAEPPLGKKRKELIGDVNGDFLVSMLICDAHLLAMICYDHVVTLKML